MADETCPTCGTELTRVKGRRKGARFWWCWRCEKHVRPAALHPKEKP